jgi:hypothetical protein
MIEAAVVGVIVFAFVWSAMHVGARSEEGMLGEGRFRPDGD